MPKATKSQPGKGKTAIYLRISDDREGLELGVTRQLEDCQRLARQLNVPADRQVVYRDNDKGASTRTRKGKKRPEYADMLEAARNGELSAIIAYSNSRLTRRPAEIDELITLHETTGVKLLTVASGDDDLSKADGRMVARIKASVDAAEVERMAERIARANLQAAQDGRSQGNGSRPFGWQGDKFRDLDPAEADLIRSAAKALLDGVLPVRIVEAWNQQGIATSKGGPWHLAVFIRMMKNPRLAGWRIYQGRVATDANGQAIKGDHQPILDQHTYDRVVGILTRPDTRAVKPRRGARMFLLSSLVRCGVCARPMFGNRQRYRKADGSMADAHYYVCKGNGHLVSGSGRAIDEFVRVAVARSLEQTRLEAPDPTPFDGDERLAQISQQIEELMTAYRDGNLSGPLVFGQVGKLEAEQREIAALRTEYEAALAAALPGSDLGSDDFLAGDVDRQRVVIEQQLQALVLAPGHKGQGRYFDFDRLSLVWR